MLNVTTEEEAVLLPVKVVPGAAQTVIVGEWNGRLKVRIAAPPQKGQANKALAAFLAEKLGLRRSAVSVVAGPASPEKTVRIEGATAAEVLAACLPRRS